MSEPLHTKLPELDSSVDHRHSSCAPNGDVFFAMSPRRQIYRLCVGKASLELYAGLSDPVGIADGHRLTHASFGPILGQIDATNPEGLLGHVIYVPDTNSHVIRLILGDNVSTLVGIANTPGSRDGRTSLAAAPALPVANDEALLDSPLSAVVLTSCPAVLFQDKNGLRFLSTITGYVTTVKMACPTDRLDWAPRMLVEPFRPNDSYLNPGILLIDLITPRLKTPYRAFVPAELMERLHKIGPAPGAPPALLLAQVLELKGASKHRNMQGVPIASQPCSEMSYTRGLLYDVKVQDKSVSANSWLLDCRPLAQVAFSNSLVYLWNPAGTIYVRRDIDADPSYDRFPERNLTDLLPIAGGVAGLAPSAVPSDVKIIHTEPAPPAAALPSSFAAPVGGVTVWNLHSIVLGSHFGLGPWDFAPLSVALNKLPAASVKFVIQRLYGSSVTGTKHQLCHLVWVYQQLGMDAGALHDELRARISQLSSSKLWNLMVALQQEILLCLSATDDLMVLMLELARTVAHKQALLSIAKSSPVETKYTLPITTMINASVLPSLSLRLAFRTCGLPFKRISAMYSASSAIALKRLSPNSADVLFVMHGVTGEGWYIKASLVYLYPFWQWLRDIIDALPQPIPMTSRIIKMPQNWTIPMIIALLQTFHSARHDPLPEQEAFQVLVDEPTMGLAACPTAAIFSQHAEQVCFSPPTRATLLRQIILAHKLGRPTNALISAAAAHNYSLTEIKAALAFVTEEAVRKELTWLLME